MDNEDFIWETNLLGGWLRFLRMDRGYSQAQLADLTGVPPSEIHRVEVGQQECRIETLLRLCGPLGATPSWILDRSFFGNGAWFKRRIEQEPAFLDLLLKLGIKDSGHAAIAATLICACELTGILVRASAPSERLSVVEFADDDWKKPFAAFARRLTVMDGDCPERATILHNLLVSPVAELGRQGLLPESILKEQAHSIATKGARQYAWVNKILRYPREIKWT